MAEDNNNEENIPQPQPFPPEMMSDPDSETVAHQVRDYLWGKGPIDYPIVSAHLKRELVSRFVEFELRTLPALYYWRVRILFDLYNLREHLEIIQGHLNRNESEPNDMERSIAGTIILEEIGSNSQKNLAVQYYEYLVKHQYAAQTFDGLIKCLAAIGTKVLPDSLRTRMEGEIKNLALRENSDPEAGPEKREIEDLLENEFFFIEEANKARRRILDIEDGNQRLLELIKVYLELTEDGGGEYLNLWVQQQIRRTAERESAGKVIEAFRVVVRRLDKMEVEDKDFCKVRCYNAIEFFMGKLNPDEEEFMEKHRHDQIDPLRFMPVPMHLHYDEGEEDNEDNFEEDEPEDENES